MNIRVKKLIRQYCPNIAPLRNWMAEKKLKEYRDHFMDAATVAECEKKSTEPGECNTGIL